MNSTEWDGNGCPGPNDKYDIRISDHFANCPRCGPRVGILQQVPKEDS